MIHASDYIKENTQGYVIHKNKIVPVTVSCVEDISYHGSSCYVIHFKEIPKETFFKMYQLHELNEAKQDLATSLQKTIDTLKLKRKDIKAEIKTLKSIISSLTN